MKKKIIVSLSCVIVIGLLAVLAWKFGTGKSETVEQIKAYRFDSDLSTDPQTITNGKLTMVFDPKTTQFTLTDQYGNEWHSTAQGETGGRKELDSTVVISITDKKGVSTQLDSMKYCVEKGTYSYEVVDESTIRVDYTIGQIEKIYYIPLAVPYSRYEEIYNSVSEEGQKEIKSAYRVLNYEKLQGKEELDSLLKMYPDLVEHDVVVLRDGTQEWKKEVVESYLIEAGYTADDYEADAAIYNKEVKSDKPAVNLSVFYTLDGEDLIVKVPYDSIEYYETYPLTDMRILPYMCSSTAGDEGYLFVPDGSGAVIDFNNQKSNQTIYSAKIYGWDYAAVRNIIINDPKTRFPVYGISFTDQNQSMLCMIESGESYGYVEADVAGRRHQYNYVTAGFTVVHNEKANVSTRSNTGVQLFEQGIPKGEEISLRFRGVDSSDYVDMAKTYRGYMLDRYPSLAEGTDGTMTMAVELIGAITKTQQVLGFPKDLPYALTTYREMSAILDALTAAGIKDMDVILNGWFNEGVVHDVADEIKLISKLGSKKDFNALLDKIEQQGNTVYLKSDFTFVHNNSLFDSYSTRSDSAKFVTREIVELEEISHIFYAPKADGEIYYLAKPKFMLQTLDAFLKEADKLGVKNVAFTSLGNVLAADYNRKDLVSRESVKLQHIDKLSQMKENGNGILVYEGNSYTLPYADLVVNMPLKSQGSNIVDRSIPFFQIALHGYVNYTGDAINITSDFITNLLKTVESGAGIYCILMDAKSTEIQETKSTMYYGATFENWKEDLVTYYQRFQSDFAGLFGQTIEGHEMLADNVYVTTYADGTKVYVNYRTAAVTMDGVEIPAQDWVVVSEKGGN